MCRINVVMKTVVFIVRGSVELNVISIISYCCDETPTQLKFPREIRNLVLDKRLMNFFPLCCLTLDL